MISAEKRNGDTCEPELDGGNTWAVNVGFAENALHCDKASDGTWERNAMTVIFVALIPAVEAAVGL